MALRFRSRWVERAGPLVLFVVLFAGLLAMLGDSLRHAIGYSLTLGVVFTFLSWWHDRRRDLKRRRQPRASDA